MKIKITFLMALTAIYSFAQTAHEKGVEDLADEREQIREQFGKIQCELNSYRAASAALLEPLLPFAEAVEKAKRDNPQGYYALALHCANGVGGNKAWVRQFLQKANDANYGNAAFVLAMLNEMELDAQVFPSLRKKRMDDDAVNIRRYTHVYVHPAANDGLFLRLLSPTNLTDVTLIRSGYKRAIGLGVSAATNELARFERRLVAERAMARKNADDVAGETNDIGGDKAWHNDPTVFSSAPLRSPGTLHRRNNSNLLEPLLPFSEAVEKAKSGYPQGYYALALHYAKGEEVAQDSEIARQFLQKANDANYGNAVFVLAMLNEMELFASVMGRVGPFVGRLNRPGSSVNIEQYTGIRMAAPGSTSSFTNRTDVAVVRSGYERAIELGVSVATNELARFERRLAIEQEKAKEDADALARKSDNTKAIQAIFGVLPSSTKVSPSSSSPFQEIGIRRDRILMEPKWLEPLLPLDEALKLAKACKGKGYYQLAVRYAQGNELPEDRSVAYKLLCKACDVNYANAVLVEGLCDEADLWECVPGSKIRRPAETSDWMHGYCGTVFYSGRHDCDILTNEVAFARIISKYTKAKELGLLEATNHIARLNNRLANFNKEDAERTAREKEKADNNRRVLSLLGDVVASAEELYHGDVNSYGMDGLHPAHMAVGMAANFPRGTVVDNSPGTTSGLWSLYTSGMSGNGFKLLVVTRITRPAAYERNLHYAVATISATGNIVNIGPELGSVNIYVGTD